MQLLLTVFAQHSSQLALLATAHTSGAALIDAFILQVSEAAPTSGSSAVAASADDAASNGSVNAQSMTSVLRCAELAELSAALHNLDLCSHAGQLDFIESALLAGLPLLFRVLAKTEQHIVKRSALFVTLAEYRHVLGPYFGRILTIDLNTSKVPERAANFSVSAAGVKSILALDFTIDMFNGPNGFLHIQQLIAGGSLKFSPINKLDFWCQVQYIDNFCAYLERILAAIGVPRILPKSDKGYTLATWCTAYKACLARVLSLPTEDEQYSFLKRLNAIFISFLKCASSEVSRVAFSSSPDAARFGSLMAPDAPPAAELARIGAQYDGYNKHREMTNLFAGKSASQTVHLLLYPFFGTLSDSRSNAGRERGGGKERVGNDPHPTGKRAHEPSPEGRTQLAGSAAHEFVNMGKNSFLISGWIWDLDALTLAYGSGKCFPVLLSKKEGDNKLAHCPCHTQAGHESMTSAAHTPFKVHKTLPPFDHRDNEQMLAYGRKPTSAESQLVVRQAFTPSHEPLGDKRPKTSAGKGAGKGKGKGDGKPPRPPNFRQPKAA